MSGPEFPLRGSHIAEFRWSLDGKTLAIDCAHDTSDVVLLREK
jgi:hypothetical protein